jgi:NAD kinase
MHRLSDEKIILVTRPTRLAELVARFNTAAQARFYVEHLGADFSDYEREDATYRAALAAVREALDRCGRVQVLERGFVPNFVFGPNDLIVTLGQDGLVANTLKYLDGQPVIGVNPDPARWDGQLLPFRADDLPLVMPEVLARKRPLKRVTMARAELGDGQVLHAVNDLFIGPRSHGSARYTIENAGRHEEHSSSGIIVSTGLGSTGWLKSLMAGAFGVAGSAGAMFGVPAAGKVPAPRKIEFAWDASHLVFTVREPFPTRTTGASLVFGRITAAAPLTLTSHMAENGVIFSDGIERDFLAFNHGTRAVIRPADKTGALVV